MDSIKNAIVTVTLLAVGYGAYVVLQEDASPHTDAPPPEVAAGEQTLPELAVTVDPHGGPLVSDATNAPSPKSPLPEQPFQDAVPTPAEPVVSSPIPPEDELTETPPVNPFAQPVNVTPAEPLANNLEAPGPEINAANEATSSVGPADPLVSTPATPPIDPSVGPIPPADASQGSLEFEQAWNTAQQQVRDQALAAALATLTPWTMDGTLNSEQRQRCLQLSDQLAGTVIYSREHHLEPEYVVKAGETLAEISATFQVPQELLAKINGIAPPYALSTGETLKVIPGPFKAEVAVGKKELTLVVGNHYGGRFRIGIGPDVPPEESVYEVAEKSNGRSYFDRRSGNEIALGSAENRYGNHWLGLRGEHITTGHSVGIHGRPVDQPTLEEGSISLDPLDAEDIFSILSVGSRVIVRR